MLPHVAGVFLDWISRVTSERGWLSTNAERNNPTGRRRASTNREHMYLSIIRSAVQLSSRFTTQATPRYQNEKLWIRMNSCDDEPCSCIKVAEGKSHILDNDTRRRL